MSQEAEAPTCLAAKDRTGPWGLKRIQRFLTEPRQALYEEGFFEVQPDEVRIRLRVRDGQVEMVVYATHAGRVNELIVDFQEDEVFAELCG